ncbi:hypothetical protein F5Y03DRAFT_65070 [Xylaria venustula]|nr:hypothetical protein F5Y03DRAFT_65070 [Xylaria venustula]
MIARGAPVSAICFRCRIQLLRQLAPVRHVATGATTNFDRTNDRADDEVEGENAGRPAHETRGQSGKPSSTLFRGVRRINRPKKHVSGNRILHEAVTGLGSDMLGKPAYAIVMRDGGKIRRKERTSIPFEQVKPDSNLAVDDNLAVGLEALLESQQNPSTLNDVRSHIHGLRPKTEKVLSEKDFRKLQRLLTGGFLTAQLRDYVEWHKSDPAARSHETTTDGLSHPEFPWLQSLRPWVPLQTQPNSAEGTGSPFQGYVSATTTPKEKLGIRLMCECWGLSIAELQTQLGETWLELQPLEFTLLMRGTQRFMHNLGNIWLDPGEKIEAFQSLNQLRLVTTKPKADLLVRDLDETLKSATTKTFPVVLLGSGTPSAAILEEVGLITKSYIRKSHTERRLHVTWFEIKSRAARGLSALENTAHIVFRLLLTASGWQNAKYTLLTPQSSKTETGRLIVDATSKDKLGWKDRMSQWARYVNPLTPEQKAVDAEMPIEQFGLPFEPSRGGPEALNETREFFLTTKFPFHPVEFSNLQTSTTAHFGHLLHRYKSPSKPARGLAGLLTNSVKRIFSPSTPHPLLLAKFEPNEPNSVPPLVNTKSTLVLRFWPSPSTNPISRQDKSKSWKPTSEHAGDTPAAPILELRLATSDHEILGVESLRAIKRVEHTDVMLPSSPVDVRFTQTQYETLQAPDRETLASWQPLVDFLQPARLDLENGKLEVPPRQRFPIPRRLFAKDPPPRTSSRASSQPIPTDPSTSGTSANSTETTNEDQTVNEDEYKEQLRKWDNDAEKWKKREEAYYEHQSQFNPDYPISVSYEFVGLELHRSASLPFEGHQLTYTSIEAGQGGGRRAEVMLEPVEHHHFASSSDIPLEEFEATNLEAQKKLEDEKELETEVELEVEEELETEVELEAEKELEAGEELEVEKELEAEEELEAEKELEAGEELEVEKELETEEELKAAYRLKVQKDYLACVSRIATDRSLWSGIDDNGGH